MIAEGDPPHGKLARNGRAAFKSACALPITVGMPLDVVTEEPAGARTLTGGQTGITAYDFRRPMKLSRDGVRLLQVTFETFSRRLTTLLTSGLRQVCSVKPTDLSQQSYEEYINSRNTPTLMVPISLPQLQTTAVMEFSLPVALTAVDHMLGGPGGTQPERTLTDIETMLVRSLLDQIVGVFSYAMEPLVPLQPSVGGIEYNPQFLQVTGAADATLVAMFDMSIGKTSCELTLCIPLAPLLPKLKAQRALAEKDAVVDQSSEDARRVATHLAGTTVTASVEFSPTLMTPTEALELAVGDVITLNHRVGTPLAVNVGSVTYANAVAGRAGNRLAALITDTLPSTR